MTTPTLEAAATQGNQKAIAVSAGNTPWAHDYARELRSTVIRYASHLPRNVQRHLGPSELDHACDRQVIGKMAGAYLEHGVESDNHVSDPWASIVGTALHGYLEQAFGWDSVNGPVPGRWFTERKATPDPGRPNPHPGTADLYDARTRTLVDHKGIALDTRVPTPGGWTTMGALREGDEVLGSDGRPCRVTKAYPVQYRHCYRVTFKGGAEIIADDVQLWEVSRNKDGGRGVRQEAVLLSSAELREQLRAVNGQRHLRVRTVSVDLPEAKLIVPPYVLGAWLGDGHAGSGTFGFGREDAPELFSYIEGHYRTGKHEVRADGFERATALGLARDLRSLGIVSRKAVPDECMRGSRAQRLELLQGLMDTDGSHNRQRNQCVFTTTSKHLADRVRELAASLGWKSYTCTFTATGFGVATVAYQTMFTPVDGNPFRLTRKAALVQPKKLKGTAYRIIQEVTDTLTVPTKCIDVDSPDHLYLVTDQFIPVHNCQGESVRAALRRSGPPQHYLGQLLLYAVGNMHE